MPKAKGPAVDDGNDLHFLEDFEPDGLVEDSDDDADHRDSSKRKRPARQRVELRNEQQTLRRQLSDWDDYEQDDSDPKV